MPLHARFASAGTEVTVLLAGLITGILLYLIGSAMDRHERAEREKRWRK